MNKQQFLDMLVKFYKAKSGTTLKSTQGMLTRDVFFRKSAKGMILNWTNVKICFGMGKEEVVRHLNSNNITKLTFPLLHAPFYEANYTSEELEKVNHFFANLPQHFIETEGRYKGKRWGYIMLHLFNKTKKLASKEQLKLVAAAVAN